MAKPLTVLIVEDSEDDALLLLHELEKGGFAPRWKRVETRDAMLAALGECPWDLVISDYKMPGFSGPAALKVLRESGLDLPFIIVSGTVGEETAVTALKTGAHDFLSKNNLARLVPAVERELRDALIRRSHKDSERMLRESEERYRMLVQNLGEGVGLTDSEETFLFANPAAEAIFGVAPGTLVGRRLSEFLASADLKRMQDETELRRRGHTSRYDLRILRPGGESRVLRVTAAPQRAADGRFAATFAVFTDVTGDLRREEELNQARNLRTIGMIAGGVAHEVRNPLFAISTIVTALEKKLSAQPEFEKHIHHVQEQVHRLNHLMEDLLALGRPVDPVTFTLCDLEGIARDAVRHLEEATPEIAGRCALISDPGGGLAVKADSGKLTQAFINLLHNALAFSPAGEPVRVRLWREGREACVAVSDAGEGIPGDLMARLFEPFQSKRKGGTGLGLAIVRKTVGAHGGTVTAFNNDPHPGATFTVRLPMEAGDGCAASAGTPRAAGGMPPRGSSPEEDVLTREEVALLPPGLAAEFHRATLEADYDRMVALLELTKRSDARVAEKLRVLTERFEYQKLLDLLRPDGGA